ncbi:MAG: phosphatase PAP2 family protein [Sulfitobacter sp.]
MVDINITGQSTTTAAAPLRSGEVKYLGLGLITFVAIVVLSAWRNQAIDWESFLPVYGSALGLLAIGIYIRIFKEAARFSALTIALAGYALFGVSMGIVFHIFMPRPEPVLDEFLLRFDHFFGYHWPDAVVWLATEYAWLGKTLSYIYDSSFAQLIGVIVVLAATGRTQRLDLLLLTGMIGLILTFVVWQLFPNFSMGIHYPIPSEAENAIRLVTNTAYGELLKDAALNGIPVISNGGMLGVVAFPSYHTVMACLVVWFLIGTVAFWPAVVINIAMIPAIHIHGAHHILDFIGGVAVFFAALWLSAQILKEWSGFRPQG